MKRLFLRPQIVAFFIVWVVLTGCLGAPSYPSRFYMLSPQDTSKTISQAETGQGCVAIGIGPVQVPEYLNRPQIVTRVSDNELYLAEFDKWAEPLVDNFSRVLSENLAKLLCTDPIVIFPSRGTIPIDYKVEVEVIRLDGILGEYVTLITRWAVFGKNGDNVLLMKRSSYTESVAGKAYEALVAAKSQAIAKFSQDVASAIKTILSK